MLLFLLFKELWVGEFGEGKCGEGCYSDFMKNRMRIFRVIFIYINGILYN